MHAVLTSVTIEDQAAAEEYLREQIVPAVKQAPGFVAAYWVRNEEKAGGSSSSSLRTRPAEQPTESTRASAGTLE